MKRNPIQRDKIKSARQHLAGGRGIQRGENGAFRMYGRKKGLCSFRETDPAEGGGRYDKGGKLIEKPTMI